MRIHITQEDVDTLAQFVDEYDPDDAFRTDYSGRGMFGSTCFGYVGEDVSLVSFELAVVIAHLNNGGDEPSLDDIRSAMADLGSPRTDSMGRSTIYYWPNVSIVSSDEMADQ